MKCGYFDQEKREYVIDRIDVPVSWTNYLGVEDLRAVANHTAGGYLFYKSPEHHRIIRFRPNGVPMDRPGHYIYLRDDETGEYWSVSWQPCGGAPEDYRCRHGLSYSVYECSGHGVRAAQTLFIPRGRMWSCGTCRWRTPGTGPAPSACTPTRNFLTTRFPLTIRIFKCRSIARAVIMRTASSTMSCSMSTLISLWPPPSSRWGDAPAWAIGTPRRTP